MSPRDRDDGGLLAGARQLRALANPKTRRRSLSVPISMDHYQMKRNTFQRANFERALRVLKKSRQDQGSLQVEQLLGRMMDAHNGLPLRDRRWRMRTIRACVTGAEILEWLQVHGQISRQEAVDVAKNMIAKGYIATVGGSPSVEEKNSFFTFRLQLSELEALTPGKEKGKAKRRILPRHREGKPINPLTVRKNDKQQYQLMVELVSGHPLIVHALDRILDTPEKTALAKALVAVTRVTKTTLSVIYSLLRTEFGKISSDPNATLRGNSLTTKLESRFCREIGKSYLKELFGDLLRKVVEDRELDLTTHPSKLQPHKRDIKLSTSALLTKNMKNLMALCQEFVNRFTLSEMVVKMPREIRAIASFTAQFSNEFCPERTSVLVGGFLLLRFLNPAIIAPESLGLLPDGVVPSSRARKNLIEISKLLQKLSNFKLFTPEEAHLGYMNEFIVVNRDRITEYYQMVTRDPLHDEDDAAQWQDMKRRLSTRLKYHQTDYQSFYNLIDARHLVHLHHVFYHGRLKLMNTLREYSLGVTESDQPRLDMKILSLLVSLGPPSRKVVGDQIVEIPYTPTPPPDPAGLWPAWVLAPPTYGPKMIPRSGHASAYVADLHMVFFFGGVDQAGLPLAEQNFVGFHMQRWEWCILPVVGRSPPARCHSTLVHCDGQLFLFGGVQSGSKTQHFNDLWQFDIRRKRWASLDPEDEPSIPVARYGHSSVIYGDRMYVFGGYTFDGERGRVCNDLMAYSRSMNYWRKIEGPNVPSPRLFHSLAVDQSMLYVFGGRNESNEPLFDFHQFDLNTGSWTRILGTGDQPLARWNHSCVIDESRPNVTYLYIYGGESNDQDCVGDLMRYNIDQDEWSKLQVQRFPGAQSSNVPGHATSIVVHQSDLYTFFSLPRPHSDGERTSEVHHLHFGQGETRSALHACPLGNSMAALLKDPSYSDISCFVEDQEFLLHRCVLAVRAPVLLKRLELGKRKLDWITARGFEIILQYVYTGNAPLESFDNVMDILGLSVEYELNDLIHQCEHSLCANLNLNTVMLLYQIATSTNRLRHLRLRCENFARKKADILIRNDIFMTIPCTSALYTIVVHTLLS